MKKGDVISRSAVLDAMPKSDVLLRHQVVDVICGSPSIGNLIPVHDVPAHWILRTDEHGESFIQCSHCKECWHVSDYCKSDELYLDDLLHGDMIYCPSCGAKMDGGEDDENAHEV